jgi:hypothetical protein
MFVYGLKVCEVFVVTLLNWKPKFEWHMARLEMKNRETETTYVMARLKYVPKM